MYFTSLGIPELIQIHPSVHEDMRGFFLETFRKDMFEESGIPASFVQENHSASKQGVLRGLHYQIKRPQGKLLRVVIGEIFDAVVDLRRHSPTFGQSFVCTLSANKQNQLWVPPGFAHGFYVVSEWAELVYKVTDYYSPEWERTLLWNDEDLSINWPLKNREHPILSNKDAKGQKLGEIEIYD